MLAFTRRLGVESALALASYGADHLKLLMYYQMLPWITVVADLRNFTVVALKCLSLGNSRQLNPSSLHTPWQLLHECSLSIWKCWLIKEDRFFFFLPPDMKTISSFCSPLNVSPVCSTTLWTVVSDRFQVGNVILGALGCRLEFEEDLCNTI